MPINPKLKELLTRQVADEGYRAKLIETLEDAPPDVQNNWMSQDEYTRQTNAYKVQMDDFYKKSNTSIDGWKSERDTALAAAAASAARIAELEAAGGANPGGIPHVPGTGVTDTAALREIDGLKTLIKGLETKLGSSITPDMLDKKLSEAYQSAVGFIGEQVFTMGELSAKYQQAFGERYDKTKQEELITFANAESAKRGSRISLDEAYNLKHGEQMIQKRIDAAAAAAVEKDRTTREVPGGGPAGPGAGSSDQGPLQIRLADLRAKENGTAGNKKVYADWREAAADAGNELVQEGKY